MSDTVELGFRRRCSWCGVKLRGWQLNLCRLCAPSAKSSDFCTSPCMSQSRWDAAPDRLFIWRPSARG